jgi:DNA-binding CsgD family transcriptional regulator
MGFQLLKVRQSEQQRHSVKRRGMNKAKVYPVGQTNPAESHNLRCPLGAAMFSEQAWEEIAHSLKLSGRELQIVREVFDDQTEFAIANNLNLSPHTIHTHCERLYHKLAVTDRVKLVLRITNEFIALTFAAESSLPPICANRAAGRCPLRCIDFGFLISAFSVSSSASGF